MTRFFRMLLAALRTLWLGWLQWLAWPWRWLVSRLARGPATPARPGSAKPGTPHAPFARRADETAARPAPRGTTTATATAAGRAARSGVGEDVGAVVGDAAAGFAPAAVEPADEAAPATGRDVGAELDLVTASEPVPAAAGKAAPKTGTFVDGVFRANAGQRDYKLYVPAGKPPGPLPLVVMLHGCKQDPDDFAAGTRMNRLADQQPMLVLYPAQTRSANPYACWNWFNRHDQQRDAGEPSIIAGMIKEVLARHPVDPRRVYAAGLSAGGGMATILAHTYPELLAAAGVHSGLPFAAAQDMITALGVMKRGAAKRAAPARAKPSAKLAVAKAAVPLIVFHGDHDKTVHPLNGERVVEQALEPARAAKPHDLGHKLVKPGRVPGGHAFTRTLHTDRAGQVQVEHWVVAGSGHAWSGGDAQGSFTDPMGPDASREMLRFFLERSKA